MYNNECTNTSSAAKSNSTTKNNKKEVITMNEKIKLDEFGIKKFLTRNLSPKTEMTGQPTYIGQLEFRNFCKQRLAIEGSQPKK